MDIYFCPFSKLKKSFKKIKIFSVFFQSPKNAFLVFQTTKYCFFGDEFVNISFFTEHEKLKHIDAMFFARYFIHTISLEAKKTSKKNERNCYHYANRKWKSQKGARASPREWKTVQKWTEKNERFYLEKCQTTHAFKTRKTRKKCLCSFFSVHLLVFFHFSKWKKIKKNGKVSEKSHFFQFFLMLCASFSKTFALHKMLMFKLLFLKIKIWKKHKKNFKNFFEESKYGHLFLSIFQI